MQDSEIVPVAQGSMDHMRELQRVLQGRGVTATLRQPPGGCGNTWGTKLQLAVASVDVDLATEAIERHWGREFSAEIFEAASRAIDLDSSENQCPACGTSFPTGPRCPSCGLRFG